MHAVTPVTAAKWLGLIYAGAIALDSLTGAYAHDTWLLGLILIPWIAGPAGLAALCVKASRTTRGASVFLTLEAAVIASTVAAWSYSILWITDPQASAAMVIFLPFCQYTAVAAFFAAAYLLGWRAQGSKPMHSTIRTIAIMLVSPPLLIYPLAHARILLSTTPESRNASILIAVWAVGMAAVLTSGWRGEIIFWVGWAYTVAGFVPLPLLALAASCSVGPCL